MKFFWLSCLLVATLTSTAQVVDSTGRVDSTGNSHANFSIDGDTRNNYQKISSLPYLATMHHDDWFLMDGYTNNPQAGRLGNSIFDTIGTYYYKNLLQSANGRNVSFVKRMKVPVFETMPKWRTPNPLNGYDTIFWVDGLYHHDYAYGNDQTSFASGSKNNMDPNNWQTANSSVTSKSDIVDVYTHVRTTGINPVRDSVWFFAGVSTVGTNGNRFFDIEVFRENFSYDTVAKKFNSAGAINGHSAWEFDATGKVFRTGDLIIAVAYQPGRAPEIDFRIFVKKSTYDSAKLSPSKLVPQTFNFVLSTYDENVAGTGGYVKISAKDNNTNWGTGLANYTNNFAADSTVGPPWGTFNGSGAWSANYEQLQFIEIGLNFSRFGMNPFQYVTSFCKSPYSSIVVKSRSSTSFTSNLEDFVLPQPFSVKGVAPFSVAPEVMTCTKNTSNLLFNYQARNYYRLLTSTGDTLAKDVDFRTAATAADRYLTVNNPGTYTVEATNFMGCPSMESKTITVTRDNVAPTASILIGSSGANYKLIGNGTTPSSSYGASTGYTYSWTGPAGSVITMPTDKEPVITTFVPGQYNLTVTENRNGCTDDEVAYLWVVLNNNKINLQAQGNRNDVVLKWLNPDAQTAKSFEIQRSYDQQHFETIGLIKTEASSNTNLTFTDANTLDKQGYYRIKFYSGNNAAYFSNIVHLTSASNAEKVIIYKYNNAVNLSINNVAAKNVLVNITDVNGRLLSQKEINTSSQPLSLSVNLPANMQTQAVVVTVLANNQVIGRKKLF